MKPLFLGTLFVFSLSAIAADEIKGFEPALIEKLRSGSIVKTTLVDTKVESKIVLKALSKKGSTEDFIKVATNHAMYPTWFPEIQDAKTVSVSKDLDQFDYWMDMLVEQGFLSFHVYPEGVQKVTRGKDALAEAFIENSVKNYKDQFEFGIQSTRLVPFEGGLLIEDTIHVKMKTAGAQANFIKQKLVEEFTRFLSGFRKALGG